MRRVPVSGWGCRMCWDGPPPEVGTPGIWGSPGASSSSELSAAVLSRSVLLKPEFSSEEESDHGLKELYQALSELILFILKAKNIQAYSLVLQKFLLYGEKFAASFQTAAAVAGKAFLLRRLC